MLRRLLHPTVSAFGCSRVSRAHHSGARSVYLDFQATTPMDPRVLDAMMPFLTERYGNPHSRTHMYGWQSEAAVEHARKQVASVIGASEKEIVFTSGGTESNNIAIKGAAAMRKEKFNHVITVQTEHKCVLDSCRFLELQGFDVTYLGVKKNGIIDLEELKNAIRPNSALVSVMAVNNEIGVIQPIREIGAICRERHVLFHSDCAQAVGKIPLDVEADKIDLMTMSGHKTYGPKGIGALFIRRKPRVRLRSPISGGGQERGIRSGTVPTPLVVGMGAACELAKNEMVRDVAHVTKLRDRLLAGLDGKLTHFTINGDEHLRYPGNLNISFGGVEGESLIMGMNTVAVSSGSACTSASLEPSYVLRAIGINAENAHTSLRFGFGRFTTEREIDMVIEQCVENVTRLREMSPLWDLIKEGKDASSVQWR